MINPVKPTVVSSVKHIILMRNSFLLLFLMLGAFLVKAQTFADLVEKVDQSVVKIEVIEKQNLGIGTRDGYTSSEGLGSGVLVGEKNLYVLTAAHVVANATKIIVEFKDGTKLSARNKRVDRTADVALIQLERPVPSVPPAKLGDSDKVRIGEEIFIIGSPLGLSHSVSKGIISGRHTEYNESNHHRAMEFFQTDAAINKGNSGGPMFNMQGEVIGIVSSILSFSGGFEGLGFAATSGIAEELLTQKGRIWMGTDVLPMNAELCKIFNVPQEGALLVQSVTENSPAYFMGIKGGYVTMKLGNLEFLAGGDFILKFDNIELNSRENMEKLWEHLNTLEDGGQFDVQIYRNGEIQDVKWRMER
jgi:S1-C subfamily serine protease